MSGDLPIEEDLSTELLMALKYEKFSGSLKKVPYLEHVNERLIAMLCNEMHAALYAEGDIINHQVNAAFASNTHEHESKL